jgi:MFS family permease
MGYLWLLRQRRILVLWIAQTLSVLGDRMYALVVMWLVWEATGSAALMGVVAVAESVPYVIVGAVGRRLLAPFATFGRLALVDVVRVIVVASLPLLWTLHGPNVAALLTVAAILGVLGALFDPNLGALIPDLVHPDQVQQVSGLMDLMGRIARVAGPGSAGLLLMFVPDVHLYTIDAATFAVSAVALGVLARMARPPRTSSKDPPHRARRSRLCGLLRVHPATGVMIGVHAVGQLLSGVTLVLPVLLAQRMHVGVEVFAAVSAAAGAGAVASNSIAGNVRTAAIFPGAYCVAWIAQGAVMAAIGLTWQVWQIIALSALSGAVSPFIAVGLRTHLSRFDRQERLSLMTLDQTALRAAGLTGTAALPALATSAPAAGYVVGGAATVAVASVGWAAAAILDSRMRAVIPNRAAAMARR